MMPGPIEAQLVAEAAERRKALYPPARVVNIATVEKLRERIAELEAHCAELQRRLCEFTGTPIATEVIIRAVCERYGVSMIDLVSDRRTKALLHPRHVAMWLLRDLTGLSLPQIGRRLGHRDHTTIFYGANKIAHLVAIYPGGCFARDAIALRDQLLEQLDQRESA